MQRQPLSTELRDHHEDLHDDWHAALCDGVLDEEERQRLTHHITHALALVEQLDDALRLSLGALRVGIDDAGGRTRTRLREYQRLHGPIQINEYTKRRHRGNGDSAA